MRKTKDDAEITRQKILDSAMNVFIRAGYSNARLEDIAAEAGVTRGAIYHHFGGKPEIYSALVNERFTEANEALSFVLNSDKPPKEMLRAIVVEMLSLLEKSEEYRKVQELVLFKTAYLPELEEGMQYKLESTYATLSIIQEVVAKGISQGEFDKSLNPRAVAVTALGLFGGVSSLWLLDCDKFSVREYAETVADIFIKGISAT